MSEALARVEFGEQVSAMAPCFRFSDEQRDLILETCCNGASPSEAKALIGIAETRGLNVLAQECYFVKRWDGIKGREVWAVQASIDAFRIKAEQSGLYDGQDEPEFEHNEEGHVVLARVRVYRKDWARPMVGVARWSEYVQTKKDGKPTKFWADMPYNQLAKCAEALALRKAFPRSLAKIYTTEEMGQAENDAPRRTFGPIKAPPMIAGVPMTAEQQADDLPLKLEASVGLMEKAMSANQMLAEAKTKGEINQASAFIAELKAAGLPPKTLDGLRDLKAKRLAEMRAESESAAE